MSADVAEVEAVAHRGVTWLLDQSISTSSGVAWPEITGTSEPDFTLYCGAPGVVVALLEAYRHFGDDRLAAVALDGARAVADAMDATEDCSLYIGLTGMAFALRAAGTTLATDEFEPRISSALATVRARATDGC